MIPLEEARALVLGAVDTLHPSAVPLGEALGSVTSVPLVSEEAVPPFDNSAMDGYAVRAADIAGASPAAPVALDIVDHLPAGAAPSRAVGPGEAIRIMTGAPVPPGADAVVMVELTVVEGEERGDGVRVSLGRPTERHEASTGFALVGRRVLVQGEVPAGEAVRRAGGDVAPGTVILEPRTVLGPAHLGVAASVGFRRVPVFRRARVGVISTGDELVADGAPLRPGQIRDSNRATLLAAAEEVGARGVDLGLIPDDEALLTKALREAVATCDAVLTSGGVSVGDHDLVKGVLDRLAGEPAADGSTGFMRWMQVAIRPAKPFAFGVLGGTPVFGLPGNTVSSLVSFELFARPALRKMMGHLELERPRVVAVADDGLRRRPDEKVHFLRVEGHWDRDGRYHVRSAGGQASHQLSALAAADALAIVPDGDGVGPGGDVDCWLLT